MREIARELKSQFTVMAGLCPGHPRLDPREIGKT
jgi:hypothetical protein